MEKIKLDFCILENPFNENKRPIIFVTRNNKDILDETVLNDEEYEKAIYAIQDLGYIQSDALTFVSSEDPDFPALNVKALRKNLEKKGMKYNETLEVTIKNTFEHMKEGQIELDQEELYREFPIQDGSYFKSFKKPKNKVPDFGERITFYFYLFLDAKFVSKAKLFVSFAGDIENKERSNKRQNIRPIKMDFIRVKNQSNPNKILFKSCQTFKDLLKFVPIQNSGSFVYVGPEQLNEIGEREIKSFTLVYDFMEIKNHLKLGERITIESENNISYDKLLIASYLVKQDYNIYERGMIEIQPKMIGRLDVVIGNIRQKMNDHAADEYFKKAAMLKKDIDYLSNKKDELEKLVGKKIRRSYLIKKFHIK